MSGTIILIGPMCCGKSTIAKHLAETLRKPHYALDDLRWEYYRDHGYDPDAGAEIAAKEGMQGLMAYWKPFEARAVEQVTKDYSNCVIDFGAGHSVYEDDNLFARVEAALAPIPHVILLLPSRHPEKSIKVCNSRLIEILERATGRADPAILEINTHFVKHPSNEKLAKRIVYTEGKSPQETCSEICRIISPP